MTVDDAAVRPVHTFLSFRGGPLDGEVIDAQPDASSSPGDGGADWVVRAVHAARLHDQAREYRWTGQTFTPAAGQHIIVMAPDNNDDPTL